MHYNIQVHIQHVQEGMTEGRGLAAPKREREVTSMLELKITVSTEAEAYERALRVLSMNQPHPEPLIMLDKPTPGDLLACRSEHGVGHSTCPKCWRP